MHEDDPDVAAYQKHLASCYVMDDVFTLEIGESCRIRNEHVDNLPAGVTFKLMYKRTSDDVYHWLDSDGNQGTVPGPAHFYVKHWEKI